MVSRQAGRSIIQLDVEYGFNILSTESFNVRVWILAAVVAMLSATAGVALWKLTQMSQIPAFTTMTVLPEPRVIDEFSFTDQEGQLFSLNELRGNWTLMFFGFTHCPDVCPSTLFELQKVQEQIQQQAEDGTQTPRVVFVSIDPERDSSEKMAQYLSYFDPDFIGITGTHEQLVPFTRQIGIAYRIEDHEAGAEHYSVDHSSGIMVLNPSGQLKGVFTAPHQAEAIAEDLLKILENS